MIEQVAFRLIMHSGVLQRKQHDSALCLNLRMGAIANPRILCQLLAFQATKRGKTAKLANCF
jgi:hypothetical protein